MMRCNKCGAEIEEGALFCDECGASLREQKKVQSSIGFEYKEERKKNSGVGIVAFILGIVSIISCGLLFVPQILSVILGIVAISDKKKTKHGLAIAGIVMSVLSIGILIFFFIVGLLTETESSTMNENLSTEEIGNETILKAEENNALEEDVELEDEILYDPQEAGLYVDKAFASVSGEYMVIIEDINENEVTISLYRDTGEGYELWIGNIVEEYYNNYLTYLHDENDSLEWCAIALGDPKMIFISAEIDDEVVDIEEELISLN